MQDTSLVVAMLQGLSRAAPVFAAFDDDRLCGFLGGYLVENFRDSGRKTAYVPEWAHATAAFPGNESLRPQIYRALYRSAAQSWFEAGCQAHAISLLANDRQAIETWFWNGFGLTVVDAVRPITANTPLLDDLKLGSQYRDTQSNPGRPGGLC